MGEGHPEGKPRWLIATGVIPVDLQEALRRMISWGWVLKSHLVDTESELQMDFRFDPPDETELRQGRRQIIKGDYEMKFLRVIFQNVRGSKNTLPAQTKEI